MNQGYRLAMGAVVAGDGCMFVPLIMNSLGYQIPWFWLILMLGLLFWLIAFLLLMPREKGLNLLVQSLACAGFTAFVGFLVPTFLSWVKMMILVVPVSYFCYACIRRIQKIDSTVR